MLKPPTSSAPRRAWTIALLGAFNLAVCAPASAATWSDTSISWRYGEKFAEPFGATDITKNIFALTHVSGYTYGTNFFTVDLRQSNGKDPAAGTTAGAQEAYVVYRHTLDLGALTKTPITFGPVKGVGATVGFDWNTKNDSYGSKKRMLVAGATLMFDVPGYLNVDLLALKESNAPAGISGRYTYDTHPMLDVVWGIPIGSSPFSFEGFALFIGSKGKDEFGGSTKPETNIDMQVMLDVGRVLGGPKQTFKVGFEYQYWRNKFGNPTTDKIGPGAGPGATAKTPMIRAEYHF